MANTVEIVLEGIDNASDVLKNVAGAMTGLAAVAGGALAAGLAVSVKEALDAEKTQASLAQVLKATAGQAGLTQEKANELAAQFKDLAGGSDDAVIALETIGLRAGTIAAEQMPAFIQASLDLGAVMGDNAAAAELLARAQEDPLAAMSRLNRAGIVFDKSLQDQIKSLTKSGKTADATALIMKRLGEATGGAAASNAETLAGKWEILQNHLMDIAESIGTSLLPLLTELFDNVIAPALPLIEEFGAVFADAISALTKGDLQGALDALGESELFNALWQGLGFTGEQLYNLQKSFTDFLDTLAPIKDALGNLFAALANNDPQAFFDALGALGQAAYDWAVNLWNEKIKPGIDTAIENLKTWIQEQAPVILENMDTWGQAFVDWITPIWEQAQAKLEEYVMSVKSWILTKPVEFYQDLIQWGQAFIDWITPATEPTLANLGTYLGNITAWMITVAIPDIILKASEMARGLWAWVSDAGDTIIPELDLFWEKVISWFVNNAIPGINEMGTNFVKSFVEGFTKESPSMVAKLSEALENMKATIKLQFNLFQELGTDIAKNIEAGLVLWTSHIVESVKGLVQTAVNAATGALGIANQNGLSQAAGNAGSLAVAAVTGNLGNEMANQGIIDGRAVGGDVSGGTPYIVGERGPELFVPSGNGTIIPNNQLSGGGSQTLIVNLNGETLFNAVLSSAQSNGLTMVQVA